MAKSIVLANQGKVDNDKRITPSVIESQEKVKFITIFIYSALVFLSSFIFNNSYEIMIGMRNILSAPSILITDYMAIGNIGGALFNSGSLMLIAVFIAWKSKVNMNGPIIAAIFTIGGFALFGKNLYNVWGIMLGVYLYAIVQKEKFSKYILVAFFGTALGPMISQVTFGLGFSVAQGIVVGNVVGIIAGFVLPPLAHHFMKFHQGFNLYNLGFTAGVVGTLFMAVFRAFNLQSQTVLIVAEGYNVILGIYLAILFVSMIVIGFVFNNRSFRGYKKILQNSGKTVADYVTIGGLGLSLINMGLLGLLTIGYILLVKGDLNGPIIGGIFTVVGFGAFGKHIKNTLPILLGVYVATLFQVWDTNSTGALLAALFGTTLAPIAGEYGWKSGMVAGFLHMAMVMNIGYLHGGMNLYNNGFSGGLIAATLVPIINSLKRKR